ncbi:MAG TPA: hypothetical protein VM432_06380 [Bdellovibrionales bacterium]|nr:hypothetical protein [Bdellovibrionales bacterium]
MKKLKTSLFIFLLLTSANAVAECEPISKDDMTLSFEVDTLFVRKDEKILKSLSLEETAGECSKMEFIDGAKLAAITFDGKAAGTSTIVTDKFYGIFNLETGDWTVKPFPIETKIIATNGKPETRKLIEVTVQKKKSKTVLSKKDLTTKKTEELPL